MPNPPTDEITTQEALEILGLKQPSNVSRFVAKGKLTPSRQLPSNGRNGAFLFWRADIIRLRDEREAGAA